MYTVWVYLHILSAMFWIGGMLFMAAVLVPISRNKLFEGKRGMLIKMSGLQFSKISWVLFLLLIATGLLALHARGFEWAFIFSAEFWQMGYGKILMGKIHIFAVVLVISAVHDFYVGPKAVELMQEAPGDKKTERLRKVSSWVGRINMVLALGILYYAIKLVRG